MLRTERRPDGGCLDGGYDALGLLSGHIWINKFRVLVHGMATKFFSDVSGHRG